jgi:hypothetical protein
VGAQVRGFEEPASPGLDNYDMKKQWLGGVSGAVVMAAVTRSASAR